MLKSTPHSVLTHIVTAFCAMMVCAKFVLTSIFITLHKSFVRNIANSDQSLHVVIY